MATFGLPEGSPHYWCGIADFGVLIEEDSQLIEKPFMAGRLTLI